ncbi:MAG: PEP-CTERM sorting domain-containing protein [Cyanobacteria bacterium P01_D01_bin.6]
MPFRTIQALSSALAVAGTVLLAGSAEAAKIYATDVVYYNNNDTSVAGYRQVLTNALGSPELTVDSSNGYSGNKDFLSLGLGGRAVFDFGQLFSGDVTVWETTWGYRANQSSYDERVDIYYGNFSDITDWKTLSEDLSQWVEAGEILNVADNAYNTASGATNAGEAPEGVFSHVLLVDKSVTRGDGFDVNAIAVNGVDSQAVPEPASILGLAMLGAVGTTGWRKRKAA